MKMSSVIKGMGVAVTVGAATYAVANTSSRQKKKMKKTVSRVMKKANNFVDGISYMMR